MFHVKHPAPLAHLSGELDALAAEGLLRREGEPIPPGAVSFCSNDYLGFAALPAAEAPASAGASRLIAGEREEHGRAERAFARWLGAESALLFSSGYAANVGAISALVGRGDLLVSDALNHASMIDGARLSRGRVVVAPHGDLGAIERALATRSEERAWVAVESYTSMDADGPDLRALRALCDTHRAALYVDEAHALGVLGPGGRGRCAEVGVVPDVLVGTLGKSFGSQGAFVAGSSILRSWLWNRARSFVFSTGLAPTCAAAATRALALLIEQPELSTRVCELARRLRAGMERSKITSMGFGHIVPVLVGTADDAMATAAALRDRGVVVQAVRPPTVPTGTSRIRLTVTARHTESDIDQAIDALAAVFG